MFWPIRSPGHSGCELCIKGGLCAHMLLEHPRAAAARCETEPSTRGHSASPSSSPPAKPPAHTPSSLAAPMSMTDVPTNKWPLTELGCCLVGPSRPLSALLVKRPVIRIGLDAPQDEVSRRKPLTLP